MLGQFKAQLIIHAPSFLRLPLKVTPFFVKKQVIEQLLSWQFTHALLDGDLDFLDNRWLKVEVKDLELVWFVTKEGDALTIASEAEPDVIFSGYTNDLILIAARKEDPDTLFFQRRLMVEGDTELGLYVKNLMDSIELEVMPAPLRMGLMQLAEFIEGGLKEGEILKDHASANVNQN